jgi:hypothetical protein
LQPFLLFIEDETFETKIDKFIGNSDRERIIIIDEELCQVKAVRLVQNSNEL